jgi:hypothetical protein
VTEKVALRSYRHDMVIRYSSRDHVSDPVVYGTDGERKYVSCIENSVSRNSHYF